jgi:hypothetical protein
MTAVPIIPVSSYESEKVELKYQKLKGNRIFCTPYYQFAETNARRFSIVTDYIQLKDLRFKNESKIVIRISENEQNIKQIINDIEAHIIKTYPEIHITTPINNEHINIKLADYAATNSDHRICGANIIVHRTKAKGGDIVCIKNKPLTETYETLGGEISSFTSPYSFIVRKFNMFNKIFQTGKFILTFGAVINNFDSNVPMCYIYVVAKSVEIKYNTTMCDSVIDNNLFVPNNNIKKLVI